MRETARKGFTGLRESDSVGHAVVPGGGWHATFTSKDGQTWTEPVVAWRINSFGMGGPLFTDADGLVDSDESRTTWLWHPDGTGWAAPPAS